MDWVKNSITRRSYSAEPETLGPTSRGPALITKHSTQRSGLGSADINKPLATNAIKPEDRTYRGKAKASGKSFAPISERSDSDLTERAVTASDSLAYSAHASTLRRKESVTNDIQRERAVLKKNSSSSLGVDYESSKNLVNVNEGIEDRLEKTTSRVRSLEWQLQNAQIREQSLILRLQKDREQLQKQNQRYEDLETAWRASTAALTQLKRQERHEKVDDQALRELYEGLIYAVSDWAITFCRKDATNISTSSKKMLNRLSPAYQEYFNDDRLRPMLLQSWLMRLLVTDVLNFNSEEGLLWAGECRSSLCLIQKKLMPVSFLKILPHLESGTMQSSDVREFAIWKAKTAQLVSNQVDQKIIDEATNNTVASWKDNLREIVTETKPEAWTELQGIISRAVKLDEEINKSRALISVTTWNEETIATFEINEVSTKSEIGFEAAHPGMRVELIVAPALVKTGTADGENFNARSFLCKWAVLCTETRKKFCSTGKNI